MSNFILINDSTINNTINNTINDNKTLLKILSLLICLYDLSINIYLLQGTEYNQSTIKLDTNCSSSYIEDTFGKNISLPTKCYLDKNSGLFSMVILFDIISVIYLLWTINKSCILPLYFLYPLITSSLIYLFIHFIIYQDQSLCGINEIPMLIIPIDKRYDTCQYIYSHCKGILVDKCNILDVYWIPIGYKNVDIIINDFRYSLEKLSYIYIPVIIGLIYIVYNEKKNKNENNILFIVFNIFCYFLVYFFVVKSGTSDYTRKYLSDHFNSITDLIVYSSVLLLITELDQRDEHDKSFKRINDHMITFISSIIYTLITIKYFQISLFNFDKWLIIIILIMIILIIIYNTYLAVIYKKLYYHITVSISIILFYGIGYLISENNSYHIHHWQVAFSVMLLSIYQTKMNRILFYIINGIFINGFSQYSRGMLLERK